MTNGTASRWSLTFKRALRVPFLRRDRPKLSAEKPCCAATIAWLTHRMVDFFRHDAPFAATWKALRFLSLIAVKTAILYVVLNGLWILAAIDFADELPQILFLRFELTGYLCLGAGNIIGLVWITTATRRGHTSNVVRQAV